MMKPRAMARLVRRGRSSSEPSTQYTWSGSQSLTVSSTQALSLACGQFIMSPFYHQGRAPELTFLNNPARIFSGAAAPGITGKTVSAVVSWGVMRRKQALLAAALAAIALGRARGLGFPGFALLFGPDTRRDVHQVGGPRVPDPGAP